MATDVSQSGVSELDAARRYLSKGRIMRPIGALWPFLKWCLLLNLVLLVVMAFAFLFGFIQMLRGRSSVDLLGTGYSGDLSAYVAVVATLAVVATIVAIAKIIAYSRFMHRAMNNVHVLDGPDELISPTGTWLWFVVPIASLWMPFKATLQIWRSSRGHAGRSETVLTAAYIWWGGWVINGVLDVVVNLLEMSSSGLTTTNWILELVSTAIGIASTASLLQYASGIADAQKTMSEQALEDVFA